MLRISKRALAKWAERDLTVERNNGTLECRFVYEGSTCNDGGDAFESVIHTQLEKNGDGWRIMGAEIEIDPELPAWESMCTFRGRPVSERVVTLDGCPAVGMDLDEFINGDWPVNNAGCYCRNTHVNHKMLLAMQTLRHWLENAEQQ